MYGSETFPRCAPFYHSLYNTAASLFELKRRTTLRCSRYAHISPCCTASFITTFDASMSSWQDALSLGCAQETQELEMASSQCPGAQNRWRHAWVEIRWCLPLVPLNHIKIIIVEFLHGPIYNNNKNVKFYLKCPQLIKQRSRKSIFYKKLKDHQKLFSAKIAYLPRDPREKSRPRHSVMGSHMPITFHHCAAMVPKADLRKWLCQRRLVFLVFPKVFRSSTVPTSFCCIICSHDT